VGQSDYLPGSETTTFPSKLSRRSCQTRDAQSAEGRWKKQDDSDGHSARKKTGSREWSAISLTIIAMSRKHGIKPINANLPSFFYWGDDVTAKKSESEMASSLQVYYRGKLLDVVSAEQAREMIKNGVAKQVAKNQIVLTPQNG